jgi:F-type H+-transporting ATPase subunit alpha
MKAVAGKLKLNLAQYREMAAFAQFGSDLDKATQEQLANGERLTEMLKQPQYQPMPMEEQVVAIYSATPPEGRSSWVRDYPVGDIGRYEREMLSYMRSQQPQVLASIKGSEKLDDDVKKKLELALDEFAKVFQPSRREAAA